MALKLYNTLTRKKEEFKQKDSIGMYTCGPTVYDYPHIGNYRAYVSADVLKRYLRYRSHKVKHVMNITDVDDKTIRGSQKKGMSLKDYTRIYEDAFFEDLESLNILPADKFPRATEHVKEMVAIIGKLLKKGIAYKAEDGSIYFNVKKFSTYGQLANLDISKLQTGASGRIAADEYSKEDVHDFALWKAWSPDDGTNYWESTLELDVTSEEYENLIKQAIKNNDKEFLLLNNIKIDKSSAKGYKEKNEKFSK